MNFLWTIFKEVFFYLQPFFFWFNIIVYGLGILVLCVLVLILLLYTYARSWRYVKENCMLPFQIKETFNLWRWYLRKPEYTRIPYKPGQLVDILSNVQNKKYRHRQRTWYRNTWAKVFIDIRKIYFESKKEK